jgi:hypothetical protein
MLLEINSLGAFFVVNSLSIKKLVAIIIHQVNFRKIIGLKYKKQYFLNKDLPD